MVTGDLGLFGERVAVALGFLTLTSFLAVALSCRTFVSLANRINLGAVVASRPYKVFFRYHSIYWWVFLLFLIPHVMAGIMHTSLPKRGDPDAGIHLAILIAAVGTFGSITATFANCRSFASLLKVFRADKTYTGFYGRFYAWHGYFWLILIVFLLGHLIVSYVHVGFWPTKLG
ncbi:hypothetical protein Dform_01085 [Dehalogenimonas formicexedens]|uniref:Uncharacterized protein n=1 Tax=Dehalogenimonas formicexedens TaxID=1839801 RepID=A0A1P8F7I7_9CHLR|nr:hypothetical protein [Dehalogenimonas formicexedens]APV44420.1 hypothetical protein Dform_01085 [Dehalogenimonas formicexedens]